jgi:hypothetical protein
MFWGCFSGLKKGPCQFWEKDWGTINGLSYRERIVPIIDAWIRLNPDLLFMQDNAPGHAAYDTLEELRNRGIRIIDWPPYSPDLNPIEAVWGIMKDWIQQNYGDQDKLSYDRQRMAVREAWGSVLSEQLGELIDSMKDRCQAVIDADGRYTRY